MEKKLTHASSLKPGNYVLIDGNACIVKDTQTSRPGKHGHAKVRIKAVDMLTGNNRELVMPGHDNVEVPIIQKKDGQILSMDGNSIEMMDMETFETVTTEASIADESVKDRLAAGQTVTFWEVNGKYVIKTIKEEA
ncbi:MAG: translation initiation factor IF-5A [Nanoarchaeota archaeon]